MDQVFMGLPKVLQWEILTDYVGGFAVRFNRLKRFMTGDVQKRIMRHNFELHDISSCNLWVKHTLHSPVPLRLEYLANRAVFVEFQEGENKAIAITEFSRRETFLVLFKALKTDKLTYGYYSWGREWYITPVMDTIELPPFVKHSYPSYPHTNRKLGRPALKRREFDSAGNFFH